MQSSSTLLIPRTRLDKLRTRAWRLGGFHRLLERLTQARIPTRRIRRSLTRYQRPGQDLVRVAFRPKLCDWLALGQIAAHLGVSRCLAFILLSRLGQESPTTQRTWLVHQKGALLISRIRLLPSKARGDKAKEVPHRHVPRQSRGRAGAAHFGYGRLGFQGRDNPNLSP